MNAFWQQDNGFVKRRELIEELVLLDPCPEGNEFKGFKAGNWAGWLGAEYAPVRVGGEFKIPNAARLDSPRDEGAPQDEEGSDVHLAPRPT